MNLSGWFKWVASGQLKAMMSLGRSARHAYRLCFLARAARLGLLRLLSDSPLDAVGAAAALGLDPSCGRALAAFLDVGVSVRELARKNGKYALSGGLARAFAKPDFDAVCALGEEIAGLHLSYLAAAPGDVPEWERLAKLTDEYGEVVARSSRVIEPLLADFTDAFIPRSGPVSLLEIGCGSGVHLLRALALNPQCRAVGVERDPAVAATTREAVSRAGLSGRAEIASIDLRDYEPGRCFDRITMHNNIYYFPESERGDLFAKLLTLLEPGGLVAISSATAGKGVVSALGVLWTEMTRGAGPLPAPKAFCQSLAAAGFVDVRTHAPSALAEFCVFTAAKPA